MIKTIFVALLSLMALTGCDGFTVKRAAFDVPDEICSAHGGVFEVTFIVLTYNNLPTLHKVRCNNGATFDNDFIREYKVLKNVVSEV